MRILGASSAEPLGGFLHVGYGSVMQYPHGLKPDLPAFGPDDIAFQVDVDKALATEPAATVEVAPPGTVGPASRQGGGAGQPAWPMLGLFFALLLLLQVVRARMRLPRATTTLAALAGGVLLVGASLGLLESARAGSTERPGDTVALRYQYPDLATKVILHGLLADTLATGSEQLAAEVSNQTQSRKEHKKNLGERQPLTDIDLVAFPTTRPSARMRHAIDNCLRDGWGRPFWLTWQRETRSNRGPRHDAVEDVLVGTLASAGADGKLDTEDDIAARIVPGVGNQIGTSIGGGIFDRVSRRFQPTTYFIRQVEGKPTLFFHGSPNMYAYFYGREDTADALRLTGDKRFDLMPTSLFWKRREPDYETRKRIPANLRRIYAEVAGRSPNVLVLVVPNAR